MCGYPAAHVPVNLPLSESQTMECLQSLYIHIESSMAQIAVEFYGQLFDEVLENAILEHVIQSGPFTGLNVDL